MLTPIVSTKLNTPRLRPQLITRPQLIDKLDAGAWCPLILISAPAGYGKTTLLGSWIASRSLTAAWLSLEPEDNDIQRFLIYLAHTLARAAPEASQTALAMLQSTHTSSVDAILAVMINELSAVDKDFHIFFDDYHVIEKSEIHHVLAYLIEHVPGQVHFVIAGRSDPPLPLSRLRARGQLLEIRQADLRFSTTEAATLFNQHPGTSLTDEQITAIESRTEGWIAGLQLAALSLQGRNDATDVVQAFRGNHHYVIDYLADEVFSQQAPEIQQFLVDSAILDRFTAALCREVTGYEKSAGLLREMEADNLFLIPMDDRREWYRYHNLYRDFLKTRMDPQRSTELHIRAANWLLDAEQYPDAVKHALAADNMDYAERVISEAVVAAQKRGAFGSLDAWLNTLPAERLLNNVILATSKGYSVYYTKSYQDALPFAEAAEKCIDETTNDSIRGQYLSLKAHLALCTDEFGTCLDIATQALDLLDEDEMVFRTLTLNVIGQVYELQGDISSAVDIYRQGFESAWRAGDVIGALVVAVNLIFSLNELGHRREALRWFENHLNAPKQLNKIPRSLQDAALLAPSLLAYEANDLVVARDYAERAVTVLKNLDFPHGTIWGLYILAKIDLAEHRYASAKQLCDEGRRLARQIGREAVHGTLFSALTAQVDLESSTQQSARRWADRCGFTERDIPTHWLEQPYFTYARILLADGQIQAANQLLANIQQSATRTSRKRKIITTHLLLAQSSLVEGNQAQACEHLGMALELASAEDYRRAILDEDPILLKLLPEMLSRAPEFVQKLISAEQQQPEQNNLSGTLINPLTRRELEVLGLVASGMSNREIAEKLVVSLGTVKKHLNNIFSKLYVESRTQAVAVARKQGLLSQTH